MTIQDVIDHLGLTPLPEEGGYFKETYRSHRSVISKTLGEMSECTAIYYLITNDSFSALHAVDQDEIFHFYCGSPVEMFKIDSNGHGKSIRIGNNLMNGEIPQVVVPNGHWQGTKLLNKDPGAWALLGCTVAPGFEFKNFHLKSREELIRLWPKHKDNIIEYTN